jgi:hypothetical protein
MRYQTITTSIKKNNLVTGAAVLAGSVGISTVIGLGAASALSSNQTTDIAAATTFSNAVHTDKHAFRLKVDALESNATSNLQSSTNKGYVKTFSDEFKAASTTFHNAKKSSIDTFKSQITAGDDVATSENQLVNSFNVSAANYMNSIQVAKNQLANSLGQKSSNANDVRSQFVGSLDTDTSNLSIQFQQDKNNFANTVQ